MVISEPPLDVGASQVTVANPFPAVADTVKGFVGTTAGVTVTIRAPEYPIAFLAFIVKVYVVPFVNPVILASVFEIAVAFVIKSVPAASLTRLLENTPVPSMVPVGFRELPVVSLIVYPRITDPPVEGAVQFIRVELFPAVALAPVGIPGTVVTPLSFKVISMDLKYKEAGPYTI
jgi:hypothetical protein